MRPQQNAAISRALAALGYRWAGLAREQQQRGTIVVCATAEPAYDPKLPSLSVCSTSEDAAVNGLIAAVKDVRS